MYTITTDNGANLLKAVNLIQNDLMDVETQEFENIDVGDSTQEIEDSILDDDSDNSR